VLAALTAIAAGSAVSAIAAESPPPAPLRVCADPGNMPLSNRKGEGFQNRIAELLAHALGTEVAYFWYPYYGIGLVRNTLNADRCDVLMDVPSDFELALTTKPYYKTSFVLVYRRDRGYAIGSFDEPILKNIRIGVLQSSPAREALREHGVLLNTEVHYAFYDSGSGVGTAPGHQIEEVIDGRLDAAETWGPIGGWYASRPGAALTVLPLNRMSDETRLETPISLAVQRANKPLKQRLDAALDTHRDAIRAILADYGVPLVRCAECVVSGDIPEHGPYRENTRTVSAWDDRPASSPGQMAALEARLAAGADPSRELIDAVIGNDPERVRYLLDHGADPDAAAELGQNALQTAVREGRVRITRILLDRGADIEARDGDGWTPLLTAVWRENSDMLRLLLAHGAKTDVFDARGWSPLAAAISHGTAEQVRQLLDAGAGLDATNAAGFTPLMFATAKSDDGVLGLLLERGANAGIANKAGVTPLMLAAAANDVGAAKRLLGAGADPAVRDAEGRTALEIARARGNTEVADLLAQSRH
jgi:quinoprotein dehydrogenase-associated probable ABC transporter substrate-binding protein